MLSLGSMVSFMEIVSCGRGKEFMAVVLELAVVLAVIVAGRVVVVPVVVVLVVAGVVVLVILSESVNFSVTFVCASASTVGDSPRRVFLLISFDS